MSVGDAMQRAAEALTVKRVFGEPVERDGVTFVPAATVAGGAGGGTGRQADGQEGEGGGYGVSGRPAGAYVIKDGRVSWRPAVDPNRIVLVVGVVAVAYLLTRPRVLRARRGAGG